MNATFPFVSPAVSLPTDPPRRVVDAGYYDNYGVATAVSWLSQSEVIDWLDQNQFDVLLIEIRSFSVDSTCSNQPDSATETAPGCEPDDLKKRLGRMAGPAFAWLTSPVSGAASARESSMIFRNNDAVETLGQLLEKGDSKLHRVIFTNDLESKDAPVSWYIRPESLEKLRDELCSEDNLKSLNSLLEIWSAKSNNVPSKPDPKMLCLKMKTYQKNKSKTDYRRLISGR